MTEWMKIAVKELKQSLRHQTGKKIGTGVYLGGDPRKSGLISSAEIDHYSGGVPEIREIFVDAIKTKEEC